MLTRINARKVYDTQKKAVADIQSAIEGDWGIESQKGLRVVALGKCYILSGLFGADVTAVEVPVAGDRYPAYFHDTEGHFAMVVVEKGVRVVKKPHTMTSGYSFFAVV